MKKNIRMKTNNAHIIVLLTAIIVLGFSGAQAQTGSAVRLESSGKVTNTIIYDNSGLAPVPSGVRVEHSLSDSVLVGEGNVSSVTSTPFNSTTFRVDPSGPAHNAGRKSDLRLSDTLDLANYPRVSDDMLDIGAYEHSVVPLCEIKAKEDTAICPGDPYRLLVDEIGSTTVFKKWIIAGTSIEYTNATLVRPEVDTRYVLIGETNYGSRQMCSDTLTIRVLRTSVKVTSPTLAVCEGTSVTLSSTPSVGVKWYTLSGDFVGDGNTTLMPPQNASTQYIVVLDDGTCINRDTVKVSSNPPNLKLFAQDTTVCENEPVHLTTNVDAGLVLWRNKTTGTDLSEDPIIYPTTFAIYEASVYDPLCGNVSAEVSINVRPRPAIAVNMPNIAFCKGDEFILQATPDASYWTLLDGTRLPHATCIAEASETYIAVYQDAEGVCTVTDTVTTDVENLIVTAREDLAILQGERVQLWSTPTAMQWIEAKSGDTLKSLDVLPVDPMEYVEAIDTTIYVAILRSERCEAKDSVWVFVHRVSKFDMELLSGIDCYENDGWASVKVSGNTGPYTYLWNNGVRTPELKNLPAGTTHSVTVTDREGTTLVKSTTLSHGSPLQVDYTTVNPDNEACDNGKITITVSGGTPELDGTYNYVWDDGYTSDSDGSRFNIVSGAYRLTVTDNKNCEKETEVALSCIYSRVMKSLYISPNGDGDNDFLHIKDIERYPKNTVTIVNSYGEEVARFKNYNNTDVAWTGLNNLGKSLPDGVYYYVVEAEGVEAMAGWLLMGAGK